jgi:hypothetical protein
MKKISVVASVLVISWLVLGIFSSADLARNEPVPMTVNTTSKPRRMWNGIFNLARRQFDHTSQPREINDGKGFNEFEYSAMPANCSKQSF